jgi:hypothetical protein
VVIWVPMVSTPRAGVFFWSGADVAAHTGVGVCIYGIYKRKSCCFLVENEDDVSVFLSGIWVAFAGYDTIDCMFPICMYCTSVPHPSQRRCQTSQDLENSSYVLKNANAACCSFHRISTDSSPSSYSTTRPSSCSSGTSIPSDTHVYRPHHNMHSPYTNQTQTAPRPSSPS